MATLIITVDEFATVEELKNLADNMTAGYHLWNVKCQIREGGQAVLTSGYNSGLEPRQWETVAPQI